MEHDPLKHLVAKIELLEQESTLDAALAAVSASRLAFADLFETELVEGDYSADRREQLDLALSRCSDALVGFEDESVQRPLDRIRMYRELIATLKDAGFEAMARQLPAARRTLSPW